LIQSLSFLTCCTQNIFLNLLLSKLRKIFWVQYFSLLVSFHVLCNRARKRKVPAISSVSLICFLPHDGRIQTITCRSSSMCNRHYHKLLRVHWWSIMSMVLEVHVEVRPHPAEPAHHTTCSNIRLVLLKMGIMMPETCWEIVKNKHLVGFLPHFTTQMLSPCCRQSLSPMPVR